MGIGPSCAIAGITPSCPGGYFYNPRPLAIESQTTMFQIPHPYQGGLIQIPGFADVVATSIHIRAAQENGLLWRDNRDGETKFAMQNYQTPSLATWSGFAKSNGLGDIDAYTQDAPVQIGNRLWYDRDHNGIQDAGEQPVRDTEVVLYDSAGEAVDSVRTDSVGEYWFPVMAHHSYSVHVPLDQPSLRRWIVTRHFVGNDPRIDSNCVEEHGSAVMSISPKAPGHNNFTYDCGFFRPAKPPPPPLVVTG